MSYLALARKWRPTKFNEVVGQAHVLTALENALSQNRLHHAYLFSGTRGVGKTSIGRLFAKGLNCETGITSEPCGECSTCREIDEGRFVDLLEIDAASRTKVEDTRELLDNVQYKPARGRFKVYLIDEVHMLSRHSFNALLKTLEEPPEYVKFLLATTDPQKLPVTILSRCLQFHLKPISVDNIHQQLDRILEQEQVTADARALGMISHAADGSMRDALSLTDQAIALGNGSIITDTVAHMLGTLDTDQAIRLLEAISSKQAQVAMDSIQTLAENGVEWDGLLRQLSTQLHRVAMYQALPSTLDQSQPDAAKIELLAKSLTPQDVQLYYQIALKGREDLPLSPTERVGLEMIVLRMMAFRPAQSVEASAITSSDNTAASVLETAPSQQELRSKPEPQPSASQRAPSQSVGQDQPAPVTPAPSSPRQAVPTPQSQAQYNQASQAPVSDPHYDQMVPQYDDVPPSDYHHGNVPPEYGNSPYPDSSYSDGSYSNGKHANESYANSGTAQESPVTRPAERSVQAPASNTPASPVSSLRHQLRSQRRNQSGDKPTSGSPVKKAKAASAKTSVLDRVAQKHGNSELVSPLSQTHAPQTDKKPDDEAYRWRPSKPVVAEEKKELTPTQIKNALEHIKTPEMVEKLLQESVGEDAWSATIQGLNIPKLVEQLALNSSFKKTDSSIELHLRATQAHLNTDRAQSELLQALNTAYAEECHLTVTISDEGETPLELREKLYQAKLQQAFVSLESDSVVQFIEKRFAAELDRDSVRPI